MGAAIMGSSRFEFDLISGSGSGAKKNFLSVHGGAPRFTMIDYIRDEDETLEAVPFPESSSGGNGGGTSSWDDGNAYFFTLEVGEPEILPLNSFSFYDFATPGGPTDWLLQINGRPVASGPTHGVASFNDHTLSIEPLQGTYRFELIGVGATDPLAQWVVDDVEIAATVPELSSLVLAGTAMAALLWQRFWRRRGWLRQLIKRQPGVAIRRASSCDVSFLEAMLFEAMHYSAEQTRPSFAEFRKTPSFRQWLQDWGSREGDTATIGEVGGKPVGAAWYRYHAPEMRSCGFLDSSVPEVCIAVKPNQRSKGVGRRLMNNLIDAARVARVPALSLSVAPDNFALDLYQSLGFRQVGMVGESLQLALEISG